LRASRELAWRRLPAVRQGFSKVSSKRIQIHGLEIQAIPRNNFAVLSDSKGFDRVQGQKQNFQIFSRPAGHEAPRARVDALDS
jgi:hypothetical protein